MAAHGVCRDLSDDRRNVAVARMFEILLPITLFFFFVVLATSFKVFEWRNILPVMGMGVEPVIKGIHGSSLTFSGYEFMLVLNAFMQRKRSMESDFHRDFGARTLLRCHCDCRGGRIGTGSDDHPHFSDH